MKIAVISRKDALERRARIRSHMEASAYEWFFSDASEGAPLEELPFHPHARRLKGRESPPGSIGAFHSHWLLWRTFAESNDDWLCILEDDVLLDPSFDLVSLAKLLESVDAHYIRLHFLFLQPYETLGRFGRRTIIRFKRSPLGAQAYLVSRQAAKQFITSITEIRRAIDEEMDRFWIHGIPALALFPFPTLELGVPSTIVTRPFQKDPRTLQDIAFRQSVRLVEHTRRLASDFKLRHFDSRCRHEFPQQVIRFGGTNKVNTISRLKTKP